MEINLAIIFRPLEISRLHSSVYCEGKKRAFYIKTTKFFFEHRTKEKYF